MDVLDQPSSGRASPRRLLLATPAEESGRRDTPQTPAHRLRRLFAHHRVVRSAPFGAHVGRRDPPVVIRCRARASRSWGRALRAVPRLGGQVREASSCAYTGAQE